MSNTTFIGIDVSCDSLNIARKTTGGFVDSSLSNSVDCIRGWVQGLPADTHFLFEATGAYSRKVEFVLSEQALPFTKVNPVKIKGFVHACGSLGKTDRQDARHIQRYGEACAPKPSPPLTAAEIEKSRLRQALSLMDKQLQDIANQLHVLDQEPVLLQNIRGAYEQIKATLEAEKANLELALRQLQTQSERDEQALLRSINGIGPKVSEALVAATGSLTLFESDKKLVKFLGLAPVQSFSGTSVKRKHGICRTAVPLVRAKLFMAVTAAVRSNPACAALFKRLRQKGKPAKLARIAVAHKLVRQAFAVVNSGIPYQKDFETIPSKIDQK